MLTYVDKFGDGDIVTDTVLAEYRQDIYTTSLANNPTVSDLHSGWMFSS